MGGIQFTMFVPCTDHYLLPNTKGVTYLMLSFRKSFILRPTLGRLQVWVSKVVHILLQTKMVKVKTTLFGAGMQEHLQSLCLFKIVHGLGLGFQPEIKCL